MSIFPKTSRLDSPNLEWHWGTKVRIFSYGAEGSEAVGEADLCPCQSAVLCEGDVERDTHGFAEWLRRGTVDDLKARGSKAAQRGTYVMRVEE